MRYRQRTDEKDSVSAIHGTEDKQGLTLVHGAQIWGCSYSQFRELVRQGIIESYPVRPGSRHRRVTLEGIESARAKLQSKPGSDQTVMNVRGKTGLSNVPGDQFFNNLFR